MSKDDYYLPEHHNLLLAVASGDPFNTSVLLWTRAVPLHNETGTGPSPESVPVCVSYSIFNDSSLEGTPIDSAQGFTSFDVDFTVKMEATGLEPDTKYWYQVLIFRFIDFLMLEAHSLVCCSLRIAQTPRTSAPLVRQGRSPARIRLPSKSTAETTLPWPYSPAHNTRPVRRITTSYHLR